VAHEALAADGTSRALGAGERIAADRELTGALENAANGAGTTPTKSGEEHPAPERRTHLDATIASTDLFYEPNHERERQWRAAGAVAVEMEAATLFAVGAHTGVPVACVLTVSNVVGKNSGDAQELIDDDALLAAAETMGRLAVSALV
jgi:uridine phosphorylase